MNRSRDSKDCRGLDRSAESNSVQERQAFASSTQVNAQSSWTKREGDSAASKLNRLLLTRTGHEVRTSMMSIIGFADLLLLTDLNESQWDYVATIRESATTLLITINELTDFAWIDTHPVLTKGLRRTVASLLHTSSSSKGGQASLGELVATPLITSDASAALPMIDRKEILKRINGNEELANELLSMLVTELPPQAADIKQAFACSDYARLADLAHRLAGSACYCGAPALQAASVRLECISKIEDKNKIAECVVDLGNEIHRLIAAFNNQLI